MAGEETEGDSLDSSFSLAAADSLERGLAQGQPKRRLAQQVIAKRYRLVRPLGRGGMGQVWLADNLTTGGHVAVKFLELQSSVADERFRLEARNAAVIDHPNVVRIYDTGRDDAGAYLVMEYVEGETLAGLVNADGPLSWRRVAEIGRQVLGAMEAAHSHALRIVHRDIKPENIIVQRGPDNAVFVKVLDFGISRALEGTAVETMDRVGTPYTMAPEQWLLRPVTPKTDLYALGCTLYFALNNKPPFVADSAEALGKLHLEAPLPHVSRECPAEFTSWLRRLLAKAPGNRPASAADALSNLSFIVSERAQNITAWLKEQALPSEPYRHLRPFEREHAPVFFGRSEPIQQIVGYVTQPAEERCFATLVYGATGVGKSSLFAAGVIPRLDDTHATRLIRRDSATSVLNLVRVALRAGDDSRAGWLLRAWATAEQSEGKPVVVMIDQLESMFTEESKSEPNRANELEALLEALQPQEDIQLKGALIFGFRKEWLSEISASMRHAALAFHSVLLRPLDRVGVGEAVLGVVSDDHLKQHYQVDIEPGLEDDICDALLADPDIAVAPTLQVLLTNLWRSSQVDFVSETSQHTRRITREQFAHCVHQGLFLDDFVQTQIGLMKKRFGDEVESGLLLDVLAQHTTAIKTAKTCSRDELQAKYGHAPRFNKIIAACIDRYLLTPTSVSEQPALRLAHDTLAPLIQARFVASPLPGQRAHRILAQRSAEWTNGDGTTLDAHDLTLVEEGLAGMRRPTPPELQLIEASVVRRRRQRRWSRIARMVLVAAVVLITASAGVAWHQARTNKRLLHQATTLRLVQQGKDAAEPMLAAVYALTAYRRTTQIRAPEVEAPLNRLMSDLLAAHTFARVFRGGHEDTITAAAFSPDDKTLATASLDRTVRVFDAETAELKSVREFEGQVSDLSFGPRASDLTTATLDGQVTVLAWNNPKAVRLQAKVPGKATAVSARQVGEAEFIAAASPDSGVHAWRGVDGKLQRIALDSSKGMALHVHIGANGTLVGGGQDIRIWRDLNAAPLRLEHPSSPITAMAVDENEAYLAAAGVDGIVLLWDLNDLNESPRRFSVGEGSRVDSVALTEQRLAIGLHPAAIYVHQLQSWGDKPTKLKGVSSRPLDLRFDHGGQRLAGAHDYDEARVWNLNEHDPFTTAVHQGVIRQARSRDNRVYTAGFDGTVRRTLLGGGDQPVFTFAIADIRGDPATAQHPAQHELARALRLANGGQSLTAPELPKLFAAELIQKQRARLLAQSRQYAASGHFSVHQLVAATEWEVAGRLLESGYRPWSVKAQISKTHPERLSALQLRPESAARWTIDVSPDGAWVAASGAKPVVDVWRNDDGRPVASIKANAKHRINGVAWYGDNDRIAVLSRDGSLSVVRRTAPSASPQRLELFNAGHQLAISPDRATLVATGDRDLVVFDLESDNLVERARHSFERPIFGGDIAPDSKTAVAVTQSGLIAFVNLEDPASAPRTCQFGAKTTKQVAFLNATQVVVAARSGPISVLDRNGCQALYDLGENEVALSLTRFFDETMVLGTADGKLRQLAGLSKLAEALCARVRADLQQPEWLVRLGGAPGLQGVADKPLCP